jgi:RNA polymerase sigma-70 factor, ECF subfamily
VNLPDMEQLVDLYQAPLYRFALGLTGSVHHAADLTQQAFLLWATKGHQLKDGSKVRSWLFTTLHREFLRMRRHDARHPHTDLDAAEPDLPVVEPEVWSRLDGRIVLETLHSLEEPFRAPLLLFYLEDLPYGEIAEALEVPIGTIMSRLSRGKWMLRQRLQDVLAERTSDPQVLRLPPQNVQRRQGPTA